MPLNVSESHFEEKMRTSLEDLLYLSLMSRKASLFVALLMALLPATAQLNQRHQRIVQLAESLEKKLIEWRRDFHQHPELSNREFRTSAIVARHLRSLGLDVDTGIAKTGVVAVLRGAKPGPVVALRADMDALPVTERSTLPFASKVTAEYNGQQTGVMHACGHDSHIAILMAVAELLSQMKDELKGTVKFIFQPAEEGPPVGEEGGARLMVKENVLKNPDVDAIFGLHIDALLEAGKITYRTGGFYASVNDMKIVIKGKSAHGASPWNSIDPIVVAAQIINNLQTIVSRNLNVTENPGVVTIGAIHAGNRSNIIPEKVEMLGTVRALSSADEELMLRRIKSVINNTAEAMGAEAEIFLPHTIHYPVTFNDTALTLRMLPSLQKAAGKGNVSQRVPKTGAEDFSFFQEKVPGLFFNLGGKPKGSTSPADHHTPDFHLDESGFKTGVIAFAHLVFDYMNNAGTEKR
jgi:amidohydrolase